MTLPGVGAVGVGHPSWIADILPKSPSKPKSLVDLLKPQGATQSLFNIISQMYELKSMNTAFLTGITTKDDSGLGYEQYLQVGSTKLRDLAMSITHINDSDDTKMYKLEQWVKNNITYVSDTSNYGKAEMWAYPLQTLDKESGDCEDGAFLLHALGLAAGVDSERLRTYGGMVVDPSNPSMPGGHAWVAYQREDDDKWITLDWCYWAKSTDLYERIEMSDDLKYIDDFWYIEGTKTVSTPLANKVRYAQDGRLYGLESKPKGMFINRTM